MKLRVEAINEEFTHMSTYNLAIASCGYESRARFFWEHICPRIEKKIALQLPHRENINYEINKTFFTRNDFQYIQPTEQSIASCIQNCSNFAKPNEPFKIIIDISSMTRHAIATICYKLYHLCSSVSINIQADFVYSRAKFGYVPATDGPILYNGPAIKALAGWPSNPTDPLNIIIGIGYEEDMALGIIEELEPANVWLFRPHNEDQNYEFEINKRNRGLFKEIPTQNIIRYPMNHPFIIYRSLDSLLAVKKNISRLLLIPLGTKIFALASCLSCLTHFPEVGYWRVSAGDSIDPVEREADGKILSLRALYLGRINKISEEQ